MITNKKKDRIQIENTYKMKTKYNKMKEKRLKKEILDLVLLWHTIDPDGWLLSHYLSLLVLVASILFLATYMQKLSLLL
jgi:hypothetical protein